MVYLFYSHAVYPSLEPMFPSTTAMETNSHSVCQNSQRLFHHTTHFTPHPHPSQRLHHSFPLINPFARTLAHDHQLSFLFGIVYLNMSFVPLLFLRLRIDLSLFQFLSLSLSFVHLLLFFFSSALFVFSRAGFVLALSYYCLTPMHTLLCIKPL